MWRARKQEIYELFLAQLLLWNDLSLKLFDLNFSTLPKWDQCQHKQNTTKRCGKGSTIKKQKPLHKLKLVKLRKHVQTSQKFIRKICERFVCDLTSKLCSCICQPTLLHVWGVTSKFLWTLLVTALSSLDIMNLNPEMGHNSQVIYTSLVPKVQLLSRSPGSSGLIFFSLLWGMRRGTEQTVLGQSRSLGAIWNIINIRAMANVIKKKYLTAISGFL